MVGCRHFLKTGVVVACVGGGKQKNSNSLSPIFFFQLAILLRSLNYLVLSLSFLRGLSSLVSSGSLLALLVLLDGLGFHLDLRGGGLVE